MAGKEPVVPNQPSTKKQQQPIRKQSASKPTGNENAKQQAKKGSTEKAPPANTKTSNTNTNSNSIFSHLPAYERLTTASLMTKVKDSDTIYPSVMQVAIEMAQGRCWGSTERCVAMLQCFKQLIQTSYHSSPDQAIARHLDAFLRPQINYLVAARPLSVSMSHAIRHLKLIISQLPPEISEEDAKAQVCKSIDTFLRNRIELAGRLIVEAALTKFSSSDQETILTFGRSSLVTRLLEAAAQSSKKFRVIVAADCSCSADDGANDLVRLLSKLGIQCTIVPLASIGFVLREATKVIIGAQCIFSNGSLLGKVGTAVVGLLAHQHNKPVMVLSETIKFTERVQLDAFVFNELADPEPMVEQCKRYLMKAEQVRAVSLVYDVMPAEYVTMVVSEVGMIPVTSVPVVLREHPY